MNTQSGTQRPPAGARIRAALSPSETQGPALVAYLVAGTPTPKLFAKTLLRAASACDVLEIGLPFSDPVADGPVIAAAGRAAIETGVSLSWLLEMLSNLEARPQAPLVLMTYLNPLLAMGLQRSIKRLSEAGIEGLIVPDLPLEECLELRDLCDASSIALVQLVAPTTPPARAAQLAQASRGFVYAVTRTGITGARTSIGGIGGVRDHLERVRATSPLPVAAGFGIRDADQITSLKGSVDAVVVGTALVQAVSSGQDPAQFLHALRPKGASTKDQYSITKTPEVSNQ